MNTQITSQDRINAMREQFNQFTQVEKASLAMGLKALAAALRARDAQQAKQAQLDKQPQNQHNGCTTQPIAVSAPVSQAVFLRPNSDGHVFYDGSIRGNTTPSGNTTSRLLAVVEARHPNTVALTN